MKKFLALLSLCALIVLNFTACTVKEQIDLTYGEEYQIQNEKLEKYDALEWASSDTTIAEVREGQITAVGAGTALVTAEANDKEVAEFTVKVSTIPITAIILSSKAGEVTEGETFKLGYTLVPENASEIGLTWKSADEKVATVDTSPSPRRKRQVSSIPLHLLFRPNPLRWTSVEFLVLPHVGAASGFQASQNDW